MIARFSSVFVAIAVLSSASGCVGSAATVTPRDRSAAPHAAERRSASLGAAVTGRGETRAADSSRANMAIDRANLGQGALLSRARTAGGK
jgi:hypothetical protein